MVESFSAVQIFFFSFYDAINLTKVVVGWFDVVGDGSTLRGGC